MEFFCARESLAELLAAPGSPQNAWRALCALEQAECARALRNAMPSCAVDAAGLCAALAAAQQQTCRRREQVLQLQNLSFWPVPVHRVAWLQTALLALLAQGLGAGIHPRLTLVPLASGLQLRLCLQADTSAAPDLALPHQYAHWARGRLFWGQKAEQLCFAMVLPPAAGLPLLPCPTAQQLLADRFSPLYVQLWQSTVLPE